MGSHLNLAMRTWYIPLALYHLPPAGFPPVILAAWWESLQAWVSLRTLQSLTSYWSWQSFPSPSHIPGISSGPGPNPSDPLHGLMDIRLKLWFQLHPLPFCLPPTPLPACQKANQLSHSWARVLRHHHHERNQQSKRKLAHSTERHLEQPGSQKLQAGLAKDHLDHNCVLSATVFP